MFKRINSLVVFTLIILFANGCSFEDTNTVTDVDGNVYHTVTIGTQVWMVENLKTTKFNDGTPISLVWDDESWWTRSRTPQYCWYNNSITNKNIYGALYNWYAVNTGILAPSGWHVPTDAEWTTLENYLIENGYNFDGTLSENKIGKSMASKFGWNTFAETGTIGDDISKNNSSGFAAQPAGSRSNGFYGIGEYCFWWTSTTSYNSSQAWDRFLNKGGISLGRWNDGDKPWGISVRCIKD